VNHEESEHDEVDGTKLGAETTKQGAMAIVVQRGLVWFRHHSL